MKDILSLEEKKEHVKSKNIIIEDNNEFEDFILLNGYTQVISVHKHSYHNGKVDNKHVYESEINFAEYVSKFNYENELSSLLTINILNYERKIRNIFEYKFLQFFQSEFKGEDGKIDILLIKEFFMKLLFNPKIETNLGTSKALFDTLGKFNFNLYYFFMEISFGKFIYIMERCEIKSKKFTKFKREVMSILFENELNLNCNSYNELRSKLFVLNGIRNKVCHNNNLTYYVNFEYRNGRGKPRKLINTNTAKVPSKKELCQLINILLSNNYEYIPLVEDSFIQLDKCFILSE